MSYLEIGYMVMVVAMILYCLGRLESMLPLGNVMNFVDVVVMGYLLYKQYWIVYFGYSFVAALVMSYRPFVKPHERGEITVSSCLVSFMQGAVIRGAVGGGLYFLARQ